MHTKEKIKPTPIWPIWVFGLIIILFGFNSESQYGSMATGIAFFLMIYYSIDIHKKNKLYFGKDYKKNPKPTREAIEKFKKNKYGLSSLPENVDQCVNRWRFNCWSPFCRNSWFTSIWLWLWCFITFNMYVY